MEEIKKEKPEEVVKQKMRQIIIETDGNSIHLVSADVSGKIELIGVLQGLIGYLNKKE